MTSVELAQGHVSLIPIMQGAKDQMVKQLAPAADAAGAAAGDAGGQSMGSSMKAKFLKVLGPTALAAGIVAGFKGLYDIGATFDDVSDTIRTKTGASGKALDGLVTSAKNVGKTVPAEWSAVGDTVATLNQRMGLSGDTLETVASQYLEAGRILGEDVDINKSTAAFAAFGIQGADVEGGMDALFRAAQSSGVGINDLATAVQTAAPAAKQLGFSFEDTAAMVGTLDAAGLDATKMTAAMSKGIVTLAKDGEQPADAFKRVVGEIQGFTAAGDDAAALDLAGKVFGTRGATQFVDALKSGKVNFDDLTGAIKSDDTILGVGTETQDFAEKWQVVKNNAQAALEPLASTVFSSLGDALTRAMPYFDRFAGWLAENQWVLGVVAGIIGVTLVTAFFMWATSIWASTIALLANPITWIVLGIVALIAGLILLIANWDKVVSWLKDVWGKVVDWLKRVWDSLVGVTKNVWAAIKNAISTYIDKVRGVFQSIWDFIKKVWGYSPIGLITQNWDKIMDFFKSIPDKVKNIFNRVRDGIKDAFKAAFNWVADLWNKSLGKIGFDIPSWVPVVGGKQWKFPQMPHLATGGTATRSGDVLVGERGPEILRLNRGASVIPLDHPAAGAGAITRDDLRAFAQDVAAAVLTGSRRVSTGVTRAALFDDLFLNDQHQLGGGLVAH